MERLGMIRLEREVPELVRAVTIVRAGRGIEVLLERIACEIARALSGLLFVAWGVGCAALVAFAGSAGCVVAVALICMNATLVVLMARQAPLIMPDHEREAEDPLEDIPGGAARILIAVVSVTAFLPAVAIGCRWYVDSALRRFDEMRGRADAVASDSRWPPMRRLFVALERYNELARRGVPLGSHAATVAALLEEAEKSTYLRPLGREHLPLPASFLRNVEALDAATKDVEIAADEQFLFGDTP